MNERLQRIFAETKARAERNKLIQQKAKEKERIRVEKKANKLLKEAKEEDKSFQPTHIRVRDKKALKQPKKDLPLWYFTKSDLTETDFKEFHLYKTREEIEAAMPNNINWELWDKLVDDFRKENN